MLFQVVMTDAHAAETEAALDAFVRRARPMLERALSARFGLEVGREASADAVAYTVENWARLAGMENPVGYLYRVGQTSARRLHRWRRPDVVLTDPVTTDDVMDVDLQRALMRLRIEQRVAVLLIHGFGHTYREVAEVLDTSTSNVSNHVNRGLTRLRKLME